MDQVERTKLETGVQRDLQAIHALRDAKILLAERGWFQGWSQGPNGEASLCGAIFDAAKVHDETNMCYRYICMFMSCDRFLLDNCMMVTNVDTIIRFNEMKSTTIDDVNALIDRTIRLFRKSMLEYKKELLA